MSLSYLIFWSRIKGPAARGVPLEFQMKYLVLEFKGIPLEYLRGLCISKTGGTRDTSIRTSNVQTTYGEIGKGCIGGYV